MTDRATAEVEAQRLIDKHWKSLSPTSDDSVALPVDPVRIARHLGVRVSVQAMPSDEAGTISKQGDVAVIRLNQWDGVKRQRFTCAHELGHLAYHASDEYPSYAYRESRDAMSATGRDPQEIYANQLAAALLMPAAEVRRFVGEGQDTAAMARIFGVSETAIGWRRRNLSV